MGDRGRSRGRGRFDDGPGGRRGRGEGRGDFGGRGRGREQGGGRGEGRGDYGGRGESRGRGRGGDFGGRGRGDFGGRRGGRGDFGGGRGGPRGGGRGGFGGGRGPQIFPYDREATPGTATRPARRIVLPATDAEQSKKISKNQPPRPLRPGKGKLGRRVRVRANHFPVSLNLKEAVHYDVVITESKEARKVSSGPGREERGLPSSVMRKVIQQLSEQEHWSQSGAFAYDGNKNLYCPTRLLPQTADYTVSINPEGKKRDRKFTVKVNLVATINIGALLNFIQGQGIELPYSALQALDTALNHSAAQNALCTIVARANFWDGAGSVPIGDGAEIWLGYKQSLRPCETGLTLNLDMATTAFLSADPVLEFLRNSLRCSLDDLLCNDDRILQKANRALRNLRVTTNHTGYERSHKVKSLVANGGAAGYMFMVDGDQETSIAAYFEDKYRLRLRYPHHPLLNVGTPAKPVLLPIEVCKLAKGQRQLKLNSMQSAKMISETAVVPDVRSKRILDSLQKNAKLSTDPTARGFGMQVANDMIEVEARILPVPTLKYDREVQPRGASWNLREEQFQNPRALVSYGLANFANPRPDWEANGTGFAAFVSELMGAFRAVGMQTPDPRQLPQIIQHDGRNNFPGETLESAAKAAYATFKKNPQIIFVLLPDNSLTNAYNDVKQASDSYLGVATQCLAQNKAQIGYSDVRGRPQYMANVAMKVNAKLQGTNCVIARQMPQWTKVPYIVFGADVTHSRSFNKNEPSVAAVVASMDQYASTYACEVKMQGHRQEVIQDLKFMVKILITQFVRRTRHEPKRIIFYRDGVSEGQFPEIQQREITQVHAACQELGRERGIEFAPPITFLVAQKRHNTRFFPARAGEGDKSGNVQAGLVVDSQVVHPTEYSFFLNSHAGLKGTSRACHYHVLLDQGNINADDLQSFTYNLCFIFCRCSKAVSMAAPAYYAHLAAKRGRAMYLASSGSDTESTASGAQAYVEFADIHQNLKPTMFYV